MDSGASFHTTHRRELLQNFVATERNQIFLADNSQLDVVGIGDVRIQTENGIWK
jgi:hypothetical protein